MCVHHEVVGKTELKDSEQKEKEKLEFYELQRISHQGKNSRESLNPGL